MAGTQGSTMIQGHYITGMAMWVLDEHYECIKKLPEGNVWLLNAIEHMNRHVGRDSLIGQPHSWTLQGSWHPMLHTVWTLELG